jgi:hypothetical protein
MMFALSERVRRCSGIWKRSEVVEGGGVPRHGNLAARVKKLSGFVASSNR